MKASEDMIDAELKIWLRFPARELTLIKREFESMTLEQFLQSWVPERRDVALFIKYLEEKYEPPTN